MQPPRQNSLTPADQKRILQGTAIRYLSFRPRFEVEVINKLGEKAAELGIADPFTLINQIVDSLKQSKFIDDANLLESTIRHLLQDRKKGPLWIKRKLVFLGLSSSIVENALKTYAPQSLQIEMVRQLISRKLNVNFNDMKAKSKLFRSLLSRGFSASTISRAFDENTPQE